MPGVTPTNASRETDQSVKDVLEVVCETENERDSNCRPKGEKKDNEIKKKFKLGPLRRGSTTDNPAIDPSRMRKKVWERSNKSQVGDTGGTKNNE